MGEGGRYACGLAWLIFTTAIVFWWFLQTYLTSGPYSFWFFLVMKQCIFLIVFRTSGDGYSLLGRKKASAAQCLTLVNNGPKINKNLKIHSIQTRRDWIGQTPSHATLPLKGFCSYRQEVRTLPWSNHGPQLFVSILLGQSIEEKECSYGKSKSSIIWPKCPLDVLARVKSYWSQSTRKVQR